MLKESIRKEQGGRLQAAREAAGYPSGAAAAEAGRWAKSTYKAHERGGRQIGIDDAEAYARHFRLRGVNVTAQSILFGAALPEVPDRLPAIQRDLPVFGVARGSGVTGKFESFSLLREKVVGHVWRPPALVEERDVYAVRIAGHSMDPMHPNGELRIVAPSRPVQPGDSVLVLSRAHAKAPLDAFVKTLVAEADDSIRVAQLNPRAEIAFSRKYVVGIHRVLTTSEIFGEG